MKGKNIQRLHQDKNRLSQQIGILSNEEPNLITERKEMRTVLQNRNQYSKRIAGWGECAYPIRTIFVACSKRLEYKTDRKGNYIRKISSYDPTTHYFRSEYVKQKRPYRSYLRVLAHELVHYRFAYLGHGKKFEQRVTEVLKGRTFPPKHVHLFAHYPKRLRAGIDLDSESIDEIKKKEYNGTLDYFI